MTVVAAIKDIVQTSIVMITIMIENSDRLASKALTEIVLVMLQASNCYCPHFGNK